MKPPVSQLFYGAVGKMRAPVMIYREIMHCVGSNGAFDESETTVSKLMNQSQIASNLDGFIPHSFSTLQLPVGNWSLKQPWQAGFMGILSAREDLNLRPSTLAVAWIIIW